MSGALIVSVSGIRNDTLDQAADFAADMDGRAVPLSLLVAPRLKDKYRLVGDEQTQQWLRGRRDGGDAIVLHGYDQAATKRRRAEFASLPQHEAMLRLTAADRVMEQTGLRTRLFAPPRWIASAGALAALPGAGFRVAALHNGVHDLVAETSIRARVYGIGGGFRTEQWWFRMIVLGAERISRRGGVLRLSVTAKQLGSAGSRQTILDAVDIALHHEAHPDVYRWSPPGMRQVA